MKIHNFSGGLATRLDSTAIELNQAVLYNNIENTSGMLTSAKSYTNLDITVDSWFYKFKDTWLSSSLERDYVEYQSKLYFTEANARAKKFNGVVTKNLGITAPLTALTTVEGADGLLYGLAMPLPPGTGNGVSYSPTGNSFVIAHDTTPFITIYKRSGATFVALDSPTTIPTGKAKSVSYSPDGNYVAVAHETSPYLTVYKINTNTITTIETVNKAGKTIEEKETKDEDDSGKKHTKIADAVTTPTGDAFGITWSADTVYLAVAHTTSPYVTIYKLASDVLTKLANPATLPTGIGHSVAFSEDTTYLTVAHTTTPFVTIYKRAVDVFTKLANPATLPTGDALGCGWSSDGTYMTVAHSVSPFITIYKRALDVFTKLADPATLPAGIGHSVNFSHDYTYMAVAHEVTPFLTIYKRAADVFTKLTDPDVLPAGIGNSVQFSPDGLGLTVAHAITPFVTIYERDTDTFTKFKDPTTLQYCYTYYDSSEGIESAPSPISDELELVAGKKCNLSGFEISTNTYADTIRLYRIGANATEFTLVVELLYAALTYDAGTEIYSYIDNIPTIDAVGDILETQDNQPPIDGLRYLVKAYGIMFAATGSDLYYTKIGQPDYWPTNNKISFSGDITGILPVQDGIFVFNDTNMEILLGKTTEEFNVIPSNGGQGCNSHKSCKLVKSQPIWSSNEGICAWLTGSVTVISKERLGKITLDIVNTVVYDETYFVCLTDGTIFAMDLRFGAMFKSFSFPDGKLLTDIGLFSNTLYGVIDAKVISLFDGEDLEFNYVSPDITEGDASMSKLYNNIYVKADGIFTFKILVDNVQVHQELLEGKTIHDVTVPQEKQRGSSIQFDITGIGKIKEIEYKVVGRQNGR